MKKKAIKIIFPSKNNTMISSISVGYDTAIQLMKNMDIQLIDFNQNFSYPIFITSHFFDR